ncbi:PREDICTED: UPF0496 protein At3g28270-like [Camelina sativa]|uniref:UPF0496 protein At3g28270-like n=1 Tax=Camelina sativa TaxID=90675 RepID=A0ABM1QF91_CAMSA|nr:PREDICTED: UPF0496 protein At3g28270-like [Camelina sativa]
MALSKDTMSKCSEHLSAYKSACEDDPDLKSFDSALQQRTIKVIDSLTAGAETGLSSQHEVHKEVSQHLLEVSQDVAKFILESKDNVWESEALKSLVIAYFENTVKTLKIFNTIESCVEDAEMGQLLIRDAVAEFQKESAEANVGGTKKKYEKTLKVLKKFKAMGDPFDGTVLKTQLELIKKQQESLLEEVCEAIKKLQMEITNLGKESSIANVFFGAVFAVVAAASIALMATGFGGFGAISSTLIVAGWAGVDTALRRKNDALKKQLEGLETGIKINQEAMETVSILVDGLEDRIQNMLKLVDNAIENEDDEADTRLVLKVISDKVEILIEKTKDVGESVKNHSKLIAEARLHVLQKINSSG